MLPNMTSRFPAGETIEFPVRFRIFVNNDRWNPGVEGKEVQPGPIQAPVQPGECRNFQEGDTLPSLTGVPVTYATVCPDTSRFPSRSISTRESGLTRKNRYVPYFDRSQIPAVMAVSRAIIRS
jgi:hypothetical protein